MIPEYCPFCRSGFIQIKEDICTYHHDGDINAVYTEFFCIDCKRYFYIDGSD